MVSLGALVGFFTVLGIAARNGIMMINHFQHLERYEGETFGPDLVIRGARERLAPILMTALATGLALVPLAIAGDLPGHEIEHPMAIVILGGLVTSTLLNLFVVPSLYLRFGRSKPPTPGLPRRPGKHHGPRDHAVAAARRPRGSNQKRDPSGPRPLHARARARHQPGGRRSRRSGRGRGRSSRTSAQCGRGRAVGRLEAGVERRAQAPTVRCARPTGRRPASSART